MLTKAGRMPFETMDSIKAWLVTHQSQHPQCSRGGDEGMPARSRVASARKIMEGLRRSAGKAVIVLAGARGAGSA